MAQKHVIGKQVFDIIYDDEKSAHYMIDELSRIYKNNVIPMLDKVFSGIASPHKIIKIDHLEIDLGTLNYESLERDLLEAIAKKLPQSFQRRLEQMSRLPIITDLKNKPVAIADRSLELFGYFLTYGTLPWWTPEKSPDIQALLLSLLEQKPSQLLALLKNAGRRESSRQRLVNQFSEEIVFLLIALAEPENEDVIRLYADDLLRFHEKKYIIQVDSKRFRKLTLEFFLAYLLVEKGSYFNAKMLLKSVVTRFSLRYNQSYIYLLKLLVTAFKGKSSSLSVRSALPELLMSIYQDETFSEIAENQFEKERNLSAEQQLEYFLSTGSVNWQSSSFGKEQLVRGIEKTLKSKPEKLKQWLLHSEEKPFVVRQLIALVHDKIIRQIVRVLVYSQADFITNYVDDVQQLHEKKKVVKVAKAEFVQVVWELVLLYLLEDKGSQFNQKSFIRKTLRQLASRYNIVYNDLLDNLAVLTNTSHLSIAYRSSLPVLLMTIREEENALKTGGDALPEAETIRVKDTQEMPQQSKVALLFYFLKYGSLPWWVQDQNRHPDFEKLIKEIIKFSPAETLNMFKSLRSGTHTYIRIASFTESSIISIIALLEPEEADFIQSYASSLEQMKSQDLAGRPEAGKLGKIKWEVILSWVLKDRGSRFNMKSFVSDTLSKYATSLNIERTQLLQYFSSTLGQLPVHHSNMLAGILTELMDEEQEGISTREMSSVIKDEVKSTLSNDPKSVFRVVFSALIEHAGSQEERIEELLLQWMKSNPARFIDALKQFVAVRENINWLMSKLSPQLSLELVFFLEKEVNDGTRYQFRSLMEVLENTAFANLSVIKLKKVWLEQLLTYWVDEPKRSGNTEHYLEQLFTFISSKERINRNAVIFLVLSALKRNALHSKYSSLEKSVRHIQQRLDKVQEEVKLKQEPAKQVEKEKKQQLAEELPVAEHTFIHNSGIVILNPYLARLFDMFGLTEASKFKDTEAAYKAVHILQYLVTGKEGYPEYELVLNKILCGIHAAQPIETDIILTEDEKARCDGLLSAVIANWSILKNTSIDGLRETFLMREGKLSEQDQARVLQVEKKTVDVLLAQLPWNISVIKLPWMDKVLQVEWK